MIGRKYITSYHESINTDFTSSMPIYIFPLMNFIVNMEEKFQTNSSVHSFNTWSRHHLHRPTANLSCFQKSVVFGGIKIFYSFLLSLSSLRNEEAQFKVALRRYLNTHSFYTTVEFFMFKNNSCTICEIHLVFCVVIIPYILHILNVCDLFHIVLSFWQAYRSVECMYVVLGVG